MRILRGVAEESDGYNGFLRLRHRQRSGDLTSRQFIFLKVCPSQPSASGLQSCLLTMSQVVPSLGYPGGRSAFFADLHLDFPRWLRLIALVPFVHASIEGISHEKLCFHILSILPSSSPPNVLIVSADCIRSSVADMLFNEPFFVVRLPSPRPRPTIPHIFAIQFSAHFRTMDHRRYRPLAGLMSLPSTLTLPESRSPSTFYGA